MTTTESLFDEIEQNNIEVYLGSMPAAKSASANIGDDYYIALDEQSLESTAEARCRLAHEAGHCITGSFYNLYAPLDRRSKHERRADKWHGDIAAADDLAAGQGHVGSLDHGIRRRNGGNIADNFNKSPRTHFSLPPQHCSISTSSGVGRAMV